MCRCEGTADRVLFHPCICTGSIKFIHQECLVQWLRYSKKEFCELCNYRFSFTHTYSPDMPQRIPMLLVLSGLVGTVERLVKTFGGLAGGGAGFCVIGLLIVMLSIPFLASSGSGKQPCCWC